MNVIVTSTGLVYNAWKFELNILIRLGKQTLLNIKNMSIYISNRKRFISVDICSYLRPQRSLIWRVRPYLPWCETCMKTLSIYTILCKKRFNILQNFSRYLEKNVLRADPKTSFGGCFTTEKYGFILLTITRYHFSLKMFSISPFWDIYD